MEIARAYRADQEESTMSAKPNTSGGVVSHLGRGLARAAGRVIVSFFLTGIIVAAIVFGSVYLTGHTPNTLTIVLGIVLAFACAVIVSLIVLTYEVIRGLIAAGRDVEREVGEQVGKIDQSLRG
jgi:hypothetical protein